MAESERTLDDLPLFHHLAAPLRRVLASIARRFITPPRRPLVEASRAPLTIVVLLSGRATLLVSADSEPRLMLGYALPGDAFPCGRGGIDHEFSIQAHATNRCTSMAWSVQTIEVLARRHPPLALFLLRVQARKMGTIARRLLDVSACKVGVRVARAILHLCERCGEREGGHIVVRGPVRLRHLALMSATTRFTACRLLGRWRREGVVRMEDDDLLVRDVARLEQIAGRKYRIEEDRPIR